LTARAAITGDFAGTPVALGVAQEAIMRIWWRRSIVAVVVLGSGGLAAAGARQTSEVTFSSNYLSVSGTISDAYNSADHVQYIACSADSGGTATCTARNRLGIMKYCSTFNANLVAAAASIRQNTFVVISWDLKGNCTDIDVTHSSYYLGKNPQVQP
jgi:hypothetical protein